MYKHTYNTVPSSGQKFVSPSQTIQGQTLSISEMLQRIQAGVPVTFNQLEYTNSEEPEPNIKDFTDIDDIRMEIQETRNKISYIEEFNKNVVKEVEPKTD
ncbi:MAG: hypothetical protein [Microvirus sp.]|nr:MAG: hypothetical protein [Microvirus sp.]